MIRPEEIHTNTIASRPTTATDRTLYGKDLTSAFRNHKGAAASMKQKHLEVSGGPGEWCIVLLLGCRHFFFLKATWISTN